MPASSLPAVSSVAPLAAKQSRLFELLSQPRTLLVALSGGADSAYLAWAAHQVLDARALAITALSPSFSTHDREQVEAFIRHTNIAHQFIATLELDNPLYVANNRDRCYHCKSELFSQLSEIAAARGSTAIAYGINADDTSDFRPGHRAAAEHQVLAPLLDAGLRKSEIRELSRQAGLPTWDRPASACLASRIPYGTPVTIENLNLVERGEAILRELGFLQFRVRHHEQLARIEIAPAELPRALAPQMAETLAKRFKALGFTYVTLDLEGYRQGSLNETILRPIANSTKSS